MSTLPKIKINNQRELIIGFILSIILWFFTGPNSQDTITLKPTITPSVEGFSLHTVTRVIDGDTIEIEGGIKVRYIGIDTPETVDPQKPVQCFGKEASDKNRKLVLNKQVRLEKDVSDTDRFGERRLCVCFNISPRRKVPKLISRKSAVCSTAFKWSLG